MWREEWEGEKVETPRDGQNLQTRSSLPSRPKTLPPFSAPLLVIVLGMGCSTTLDWKSVTFLIGRKTCSAMSKISVKIVTLLATVAVPNSWLGASP